MIPQIHSKVFAASLPCAEKLVGPGSIDRALGIADIDRRALADPPLFIPLKVQAALAEALARDTGLPAFAATATRNMPYEQLGVYADYVLGAYDLQSAIERGIKGFKYIYHTSTVSLHVNNGRTFLAFDLNLNNIVGASGLEEGFIQSLIKLVRHFAGERWTPARVQLRRQHNGSNELLEDLYGAEIHYGAPLPGIIFPANILKIRNPTRPDAGTATMSRELLKLVRQYPGDRFSGAVKQAIDLQMRVGEVSIDQVAERLSLGIRTLQRRLAAESDCFQNCLDSFRLDRAKSLLAEESYTVAEIAASLGFEEPNSFRRAFKNWTGINAKTFRKMKQFG